MSGTWPALRRLPAGEFWMGENPDDKFANDTERPRHLAHIDRAFEMGVHPVTVGEFRQMRPNHSPCEPDDWPVVNVRWGEAVEYCGWLRKTTNRAFRLPSESEWEYAARAGSKSPFPWGDTISPADANYLYDERGTRVGPGTRTPVGTYSPNAWGLHDVAGNVCEWCADLWRPGYRSAPVLRRVIRGGAWDYMPRLLRVSWRDGLEESLARDNVGFRVACDP